MFDNLSERLSATLKSISGRGRLTEDNIKETLREVRLALLDADVALPVIKEFTTQITEKAIGLDVSRSLTPGQEFIKIVQRELELIMGDRNESLNLAMQPPAVILMAGLQGAGKTTSVAKLAKLLIERDKKSVLVVSADIYRPAAIEQLQTLANEVGAQFFPSSIDQSPIVIAKTAIAHAKLKFIDVVIVDTAGRLHIDDVMMTEIKGIHQAISPIETLFVVDAMTGQDAANTAKHFGEALPLTGIILTKTDGDARGGAALSVRHITGKPIKFLGVGEKTDALDPFYPERLASRILGMGDMLSLIENLEKNVDKEKAKKLATKIQKNKGFDLEDFREQLVQMRNMGGITSMIDKLPGMGDMKNKIQEHTGGQKFDRMEVIINSMTLKERLRPELIKGSRKKRIAMGSGTQVQDVNRLLKQFDEMQKMMKKVQKGGVRNMMRQMKGMVPGGGMNPFSH